MDHKYEHIEPYTYSFPLAPCMDIQGLEWGNEYVKEKLVNLIARAKESKILVPIAAVTMIIEAVATTVTKV